MPAIFFLFSLAKPALVREKLSNKRLFFARSQLWPPLHAHGAPTGSSKLDLLWTELKSFLLRSFSFTPGGFPGRALTGTALRDEGAPTPTELDLNS